MKNCFASNIVSLFAAFLVIVPVPATAEKVAIAVADFTVFVDPPTGFVFVKLPKGWKFVGKVEPADVAGLPGNVVTSLLIGEDDADAPSVVIQKSLSCTSQPWSYARQLVGCNE